jgi:NAD(P)-dependent dehydrogenase (short-subunit alcohol dehydrogenase family)
VGARIINMASIMGLLSLGSTTAYASSKHAAIAFTVGLRMELKGFGVQVSAVNPSFHGTGLVHQLGDAVTGLWKGLSQETRDKYGEGT